MSDLLNHIDLRRVLSPAAAVADNTPQVGQIVAHAGFSACVYAINIGALVDADATFVVTMDHGDAANLSDAVAVPASQISGTLALAGFDFSADNKLRKVGYKGSKAYSRLTITPVNNGGNAFISAIAILSNARFAPTVNPPA